MVPVVGLGLKNPLISNNLREIRQSSIPDYSLTTFNLLRLTWTYTLSTRLLAILLAAVFWILFEIWRCVKRFRIDEGIVRSPDLEESQLF